MTFQDFYNTIFLPEHQHASNRLLHVLGIGASSLVVLAACYWRGAWLLLLLLYPVFFALPGLLGHRLYERSASVGDVRVTRTDHPKRWFWWANYVMTWDMLRGKM